MLFSRRQRCLNRPGPSPPGSPNARLVLLFACVGCALASAFRKRRYLPVKLPKLHIVAVHQLLGVVQRIIIIDAYEFDPALNAAVRPNKVSAVIRHGAAPLEGGSATVSQSPIAATRGAMMKRRLGVLSVGLKSTTAHSLE